MLNVSAACKNLNVFLVHRYDDAQPGQHPPPHADAYGPYSVSPVAHWDEQGPEGGWQEGQHQQAGPGPYPGDAAMLQQQQQDQAQRKFAAPGGSFRRNRRGGRRHRRPPSHPNAG